MRKRPTNARLAVGLVLSGALALGVPVLAGVPVMPRGMPDPAPMPLLIPVQDRGEPGTGSSGSSGGSGGGGGDAAAGTGGTSAAAAAPAATPQAALTTQVTQAIAESVGDAFDACRNLASGYQIDCYGQQLRSVAAQVAPAGAYGEVNIALEQASRRLAEITRRDRDSNQTRISVQHSGRTGINTYSAVRTATLAQSRAAAARVLDDVQTVLLRSAANSGNRRAHFQRIAAAMESGKVLLRSS